MNEHPQVGASANAASHMRENRKWARNPSDEVAFLGVLDDAITEVCCRLDRESLLDRAGLAVFAAVAEIRGCGLGAGPNASAELVLLSGVENAIQGTLAGLDSTDNTGEDKSVKPSSIGRPAPPS